MSSTCLLLLGRPAIRHAGATNTLPSERGIRLLALLAVRREWVERAELAALFWPGLSHERALANLRKAVHLARALPWAAALEAQGNALRLRIPTDMLDFDAALREGRIVDAIALYRGELLDGFDDPGNGAWSEELAVERAQLRRRWDELTRVRLRELDHLPDECASFARRLLDADPLDQDAMVALLTAQRALQQFDQQRDAYRSYVSRLADELGIEPSQRVRDSLRDVPPVPGTPSGGADSPGNGAPGFVGRAGELRDLAALLARDDCRLVTVLGPGGVGKSSLLKSALRQLAPRFADGALWIALDDLTDNAQVAARVAAELKLTPASPRQSALQATCEHLVSRRLLIVLDNGEHLGELARLVEHLLAASAFVKVCVTSRVRLNAQGEWLLPLQGLALAPPNAEAALVLASDAARLFVGAASAAKPDFNAASQAFAINLLLHALGGLPLAILLAAHWARLLPVAEIALEIERSLDVLESADEGEERAEHRSVRATFERSWQMLAPREERALAGLSVFVGTFSRQAALDVAGAALPLLAALTDKSLLYMTAGDARCALHPLVRQFASERLDAASRAAALRRHAEWFVALLAQLGRAVEAGDTRAFDAIDVELENCRQAWRWAITHAASDALAASASALMRFFELRGRTVEGFELLREAQPVACSGPAATPAAAAAVTAAIAHLQFRMYQLDAAAASARRGVGFARAAGSRAALMTCLNVLGICHWQGGRNLQARRFFEQALRHARAGNNPSRTSAVLSNLAGVEKALGNYDAAQRSMQEALAQQREAGDWVRVASLLNNLSALHQARSQWLPARVCLDEAIELSERHGIAQVRPHLLMNQAVVCYFSGDVDAAEHIAMQTLDVARAMANRAVEAQALLHLARIAVRRGECIHARARLHAAIECAAQMGYGLIRLDFVLAYATLLAVEGDAAGAAALSRYCLAQQDLEPTDVATAQSVLDGLPAGAADTPPPRVELEVLVRQIAAQVRPA